MRAGVVLVALFAAGCVSAPAGKSRTLAMTEAEFRTYAEDVASYKRCGSLAASARIVDDPSLSDETVRLATASFCDSRRQTVISKAMVAHDPRLARTFIEGYDRDFERATVDGIVEGRRIARLIASESKEPTRPAGQDI